MFAMALAMVQWLRYLKHWRQHPLRCLQVISATMTSTNGSGCQKVMNWNGVSFWHLGPSSKRPCAIPSMNQERTISAKKRAANVLMIVKIRLASFT